MELVNKLLSNEITILEFITKSHYLYEFYKEDYYKNIKFFEEKIEKFNSTNSNIQINFNKTPLINSIEFELFIIENNKITKKSYIKFKELFEKEWFTDYSYTPYKTSRPYLNDENECFLIGIDKKGTKYYYVETDSSDAPADLIMGVEEDFAFVHRFHELDYNNRTLLDWVAFENLLKQRTVNTTNLSILHRLLYLAHSLYNTLKLCTYGTGLIFNTSIENNLIDEITANKCKEKLKLIKQEIVNILSC